MFTFVYDVLGRQKIQLFAWKLSTDKEVRKREVYYFIWLRSNPTERI
jgi:hypothetical protein